ncbi:MAG: pilus assembly protein PilM [Candidatus Omnitrophota bacterium]|nr:pilus assembly protein PilM [Candidatus Omnitrophota bacterium]
MNSLGIYFGPKSIRLVETKGRKLIKSVQIPQPAITGNELEARALVEVTLIQLVALIKDELRKNQIEVKKVSLCLSGKDLIIRAFEIPLLPRSELKNAVNFEAKKYIPFKGEDIVSDFQIERDSANKINQVLFVAIKKQSLERYVSLLGQLGVEISGIEYSAFSLLKFLKLAGLRDNNVTAVISADLQGEDEANFLVLKNGFPLFSRDFSMFGAAEFIAKTENAPDSGMALEKFKTEIRVSLDYFHRKFSDKNIQKVILISNPGYHNELEAFMKEINLPVQFVDFSRLNKILGKDFSFNLGLLKSYSSSLSNIRTKLKLHLLAARAKPEGLEKGVALDERLRELFANLKIGLRVVSVAALVCLLTFGVGILRTLPFKKEVKDVIAMRPKTTSIDPASSYEESVNIQERYQDKLNTLDKLIKGQLYMTEALDIIPRMTPEGLWLTDFKYQYENEQKRELVLQGTCYLGDRAKELDTIDKFLSDLRDNPNFKKFFKDLKIVSVERKQEGDVEASDFIISTKGN